MRAITGPSARMFAANSESVKKEENKSDEEWIRETSSKEMFSVLAWSDSKAVGLGRTKLRKSHELTQGDKKDVWNLRNGWVDPQFERQGIQTKMIALRLKEIARRNREDNLASAVLSHTDVANVVSKHNLEKFGFKVVSKGVDENGDDFYTLALDINDPGVMEKVEEVLAK